MPAAGCREAARSIAAGASDRVMPDAWDEDAVAQCELAQLG